MNTQSLKSVAALFGVAVLLQATALAGPDPQFRDQTPKANKQTTVAVSVGQQRREFAPVAEKTTTKTHQEMYQVAGPHGTTYSFRTVTDSTR